MKVISTNKLPIKMWLKDVELKALDQAENLANLPFAYKHIALMPDCHMGYGMPIGGVLATKGYVIPNSVGVDIGCGMCAVKTHMNVDHISIETRKQIMSVIRKIIPMGMGGNHKKSCTFEQMPNIEFSEYVDDIVIDAMYQLGTLGSGNHFIELQKDEKNNLWIMLHSGSRKLGHSICMYYNKLATELNERYFSTVDKKQELAFLDINSDEGKDYMMDMKYATEFAFLNRQKMMFDIMEALKRTINKYESQNILFDGDMINVHHNYATWENHFGENVIVHRKGATSAKKGEIGLIPGSQGSSSYVVEGLGNPDSFMSCSHGAGRTMSRSMARKTLSLVAEKKKLDDQGIIHGIRNNNDLDEATGSYKDIDEVMANQDDLVTIKNKLTPIAVLKG